MSHFPKMFAKESGVQTWTIHVNQSGEMIAYPVDDDGKYQNFACGSTFDVLAPIVNREGTGCWISKIRVGKDFEDPWYWLRQDSWSECAEIANGKAGIRRTEIRARYSVHLWHDFPISLFMKFKGHKYILTDRAIAYDVRNAPQPEEARS